MKTMMLTLITGVMILSITQGEERFTGCRRSCNSNEIECRNTTCREGRACCLNCSICECRLTPCLWFRGERQVGVCATYPRRRKCCLCS